MYFFFICSKVEATETINSAVEEGEGTEEDIYTSNIEDEQAYYWGTSVCKLEGSSFIIRDGIISEDDPIIWNTISGQLINDIQNIIFENVKYIGKMDNMCNNKYLFNLVSVDFSGLDTSETTSMENLFSSNSPYLTSVTFGDKKNTTSKVTSLKNMFYSCKSLKSVNLNGLDTKNVKTMQGAFQKCNSLEEVIWNELDTSNVMDMRSLFRECTNLTYINLSNIDTRNVRLFDSIFRDCISLKEFSVSNWDVSNATSMAYMFYNCQQISTFSQVNWDVSKVTSMMYMFYNCREMSTFDVQMTNTNSVETMEGMFANVSNLKQLDLRTFDTESVKTYKNMFRSMNKLEYLNISGFDTINNQNMENMLAYTPNLRSMTLGTKSILNESTKLPPIAGGGGDETGLPNSWVSTKNYKTYLSTIDFVNNYFPIEDREDTFVRGYAYQIQYYNANKDTLLFEESRATYEQFYLKKYETVRQYNTYWQLNDKIIYFDEPEINLGINVSTEVELEQVTKVYSGELKDKEAVISGYWDETESINIRTEQDRSFPFVKERICLTPLLDLGEWVINDNDKEIYYKIEAVNDNDEVVDSMTIKTILNEENEIDLLMSTKRINSGDSNIRLDFYQLSFEETVLSNKIPITELPCFQLQLSLTLTTSLKIVYNTPDLKWNVLHSESQGILERSSDNQIKLEVLNSQDNNNTWKVNIMVVEFEKSSFDFIWKTDKSDSGRLLETGVPFVVMGSESSKTEDSYNYVQTWEADYGLLIKNDSLIYPGVYGDGILVKWTLEQSPDFS